MQQPAYQAYQLLHWGYIALPIIAGLDKFFHVLTAWHEYLAPVFANLAPGHIVMNIVGVVEILAGFLVAFKPRLGGYVVALWLWCIIINLLMAQSYYDIALRDFGLSLGVLALARLSYGLFGRHDIEPVEQR